MKKRQRRLALIAGIAAALLIAAAALWWFRAPLLGLIPAPPLIITDKDQGRVIHVIPGGRIEVRLSSNTNSSGVWRVGRPLPFLPQTGDVTFTRTPNAATEGDGYQSMTFIATGKGSGPLLLGYVPRNDQNSYMPSRSFSVIISVP